MSTQPDRPVSDHLHPVVYVAIVALALWFILSVWAFATDGYTDYLLVVVSGFIVIAVGLPYVLWRVWRTAQRSGSARRDSNLFGEWASGDFATWQDRVRGSRAAVEILLPIAAVAFGMTAFGIVLHFTAHAAS
jgi:ABC-type nickel/cobalt efflux system permease component RcnA